MDLGDVESSLNVLVIGENAVGKTAFTSMFCRGEFPIQHRKTIGTEFKERDVCLEDDDGVETTTNLMLWEIGGEHVLAPMNAKYFSDANAVALVFSTTDRASFEKVPELYKMVRAQCSEQTLVVLVQNKVDLLDYATMSNSEVEQLARELRVKLYRVSCKDQAIVEQVYYYIACRANSSAAVSLTDIGAVVPQEAKSTDEAVDKGRRTTDLEDMVSSTLLEIIPEGEPSPHRSTAVVPNGDETTSPATRKASKQRTGGSKVKFCACM